MLSWFDTTVAALNNMMQPDESFAVWFEAEQSQFVRCSRGRIRQAMQLQQAQIQLQFMWQNRVVTGRLLLQGDPSADKERLQHWLKQQRDVLRLLPADPHLLVPSAVNSSESIHTQPLPTPATVLQDILTSNQQQDLVGLYSCGPIYRGFANHAGQRNAMQHHSFNLDCSLYNSSNQAVKLNYAGSQWNCQAVQQLLQQGHQQLQQLQRPSKTIQPGSYRAYLAPAAVAEILHTLACWGAFSLQAHQSKSSVLQQMQPGPGKTCLHSSICLQENTAQGFGPNFQQQGFIRPNCVNLIEQGALQNHLVSPRSSQQYNTPCNAANDAETPESLQMAPGQLDQQQILKQLDTGLYIGNLWYINPSDLPQARLTGMTRFFTCWVQNGQLQGPIAPMRFDDTIYNLFGQQLEQLTQQRQLFLDPSTYDQRSTNSMYLPGMLLSALQLTL
ncbi:MAG: metallopeptidase TldD-related protein [Myxococcota bacterium]